MTTFKTQNTMLGYRSVNSTVKIIERLIIQGGLQILTYPCISADTVTPLLSIIASTSSTTSKYASLFAYFTPDRRQGTFDN